MTLREHEQTFLSGTAVANKAKGQADSSEN